MSQLSKNESMPVCPLSQVRKLVTKTSDKLDDTEISLELLLTMCFPTVWANIQRALQDSYTQGYLAAKQEASNENQRNN